MILMGTLLEVLADGLTSQFSYLFGTWDDFLTILIAMQILDIVTGLMIGWSKYRLSSREMRDGVIEKFAWWILIIVAHFIDLIVFDNQPILQTTTTTIAIANEGLSITENLGEMGIIIPENVTNHLIRMRTDSEKTISQTRLELDGQVKIVDD